MQDGDGFNEAGATPPRKHWTTDEDNLSWTSFNEAGATPPRKPSGTHSVESFIILLQ